MMIDPPRFDGDPRVNAYIFLFYYRKRLHVLGLVDSNGVYVEI